MGKRIGKVFLRVSFLVIYLVVGLALSGLKAFPYKIDDVKLVKDRTYYQLVRLLKISGVIYPSFSPNGRYMLVTSGLTGVPQLWRVNLTTGELSQLTFFSDGVSGGFWTPSGWIVLSKDIGGNEREQVILLSSDASKLKVITSDPDSIHVPTAFSRDGRYIAYYTNERDQRYFDVVVYDVKAERVFRTLALDKFLVPVEFSYDGKYLIALEYLSNVEERVLLLNLEDGSWKYLNLPIAEYSSVKWVPHENGFFFISDYNSEYPYIAFYDLGTDKWTKVYSDFKNVEEIEVSPDGKFLAIVVNEEGYSKLSIINRLSGRDWEVELPEGVVYSVLFSPDGGKLAINLSSSDYPASVYIYDIYRDKLTLKVTPNLSGFKKEDFVKPKLIYYSSFDGTMIPAWLYLPRNFKEDKKYPCIIWYHGGPEGQARPNFSTFAQLMAMNGFVVLRPNVRGSSGYGRKWLQADNVRNRWVSLKDGYWANLYARTLKFVDPDRIYAYGGSYGGYMVLAQLTFWPDAWKGGVEVVGISDLISFLEKTGPWRRKVRISEYGDPERDKEFLMEVSPYYHAERIKAPLLIIHGKNDPRVPVEQATKMAEKLKELGKPYEILIFPDEGHGFKKFNNRLKAYTMILKFFKEGEE